MAVDVAGLAISLGFSLGAFAGGGWWCLRRLAQARLLLGSWFVNHQPSWVKLTLDGATEALRWGCNDLGGTLMEETITRMAGAQGGSAQSPEAL